MANLSWILGTALSLLLTLAVVSAVTLWLLGLGPRGSNKVLAKTEPSLEAKGPDIVVVGGGLAGICAAIAAAENGSSVTVLDRGYGGGSTAISAGVIYAGGGTRQQIEAGYANDTPDNMFRYLLQQVGDVVDEPTLWRFCKESVLRMEWLESHGVRFEGTLCPFKTSLPPPTYSLFFSGNEKAYPFSSLADPAPRGHRPLGKGWGPMKMTGPDLWKSLYTSATQLGVKLQVASKAEEIVLDDVGRIIGVRYRALDDAASWVTHKIHAWLTHQALKQQGTFQAMARCLDYLAAIIWEQGARSKLLKSRVVILAAGGFVMNQTLLDKFIPVAKHLATLGTAGDDGSGIQLGQSVKGSVSNMDRFTAWRLIYPPEAMVEGIIVSPTGARIAAEDIYGASFSEGMISTSHGRGFLILDSKQWSKVKEQMKYQTYGLWKIYIYFLVYFGYSKATTLEELARKLKVDPSQAKKTVDAYNSAIMGNQEDPFRKLEYRSTISTGPFYGIDISLRKSGLRMTPAFTLGGLRVEGASGLVYNEKGETITGLYAVGRNAVGVCSNTYISGLSIADCVFSGKKAGEHAART